MLFHYLKQYEKNSIFVNLIMVLVSIFLIVNPQGILNWVIILLGIGISLDGLFHIVSYLRMEKEYRVFSSDLAEGILKILLGIFCITNKTFILSVIPFVIGIWVVLQAILKLQIAFNIRSSNQKQWLGLLATSMISILLGILILIHPFTTTLAITVFVGILLLITSLISLVESIIILCSYRNL